MVQLQSGVRGIHPDYRHRGNGKLARFSRELQELEDHLPIEAKFRNPKLGGSLTDPCRGCRVLVWRRQPRRADCGVQPAERRTRRRAQGLEARNAQEFSAGEIRQRAGTDFPACARRRRPGAGRIRALLHAHSHARADAWTRPADHPRRRTRDDSAPGAQGAQRSARGSQGRHLGPVGAAVSRRQGRSAARARNAPSTRPSSPQRFALCASASPIRTPRAWRYR